ncbi:aminodeoxychorismate lyase [Mycolicibacterium sediminis]|nr:aminodeoxychorismate lyase [Mycolicibacterium sediminis]
MTPRRATDLVVGLDGHLLDPGAAVLHPDDPVLARGDGVFETVLVRHGRACLLDAHLSRLAASAATTGLPAPDVGRFRAAVDVAVRAWPDAEGMLRLLYGRATRGTVAFVTVSAVPDRVVAARRDGVSVVTLDAGHAVPGPWSVATAKSLSYGRFAAAQRQAERAGASDAMLIRSDGNVLEGARSTVVVSPEPGVLLSPPLDSAILPGTTADALFDAARRRGWRCEHGPLGIADLDAAQGLWLVSAVTLAARVHTLDGRPLRAAPAAADVAYLVDLAVATD